MYEWIIDVLRTVCTWIARSDVLACCFPEKPYRCWAIHRYPHFRLILYGMRRTGRRRRKRITKLAEFQKAGWYLARGYPQEFVAWKLGVHVQTVKKWNHRHGTTDRTVHRLIARIRRLEPWHQEKLFLRLAKLHQELHFLAEPKNDPASM